MDGVKEVFPNVERMECKAHLVMEFKERFHDKVFDDNLCPTTYACNPYCFNKH